MLPALAESAQPVLATMGRLAAGRAELRRPRRAPDLRSDRRRPIDQPSLSSDAGDDGDGRVGWVSSGRRSRPRDRSRAGRPGAPAPPGHLPRAPTETLAMLRNMGIEEVVVAGVSTNLAIPLVAVGAADEDFSVTIPTDALHRHPARASCLHAQEQLGVRGSLDDGRRSPRRVVGLMRMGIHLPHAGRHATARGAVGGCGRGRGGGLRLGVAVRPSLHTHEPRQLVPVRERRLLPARARTTPTSIRSPSWASWPA